MSDIYSSRLWLDGKEITFEELVEAVNNVKKYEKAYIELFSINNSGFFFSTEFRGEEYLND